jgi:hypothetical protein
MAVFKFISVSFANTSPSNKHSRTKPIPHYKALILDLIHADHHKPEQHHQAQSAIVWPRQ